MSKVSRVLSGVAAATTIVATLTVAATPAYAATTASADPSCTAGSQTSGSTTTVTFCYVGAEQTWKVPDGATDITADVKGAAGGLGQDSEAAATNPGGLGGEAAAGLAGLSSGDSVAIFVGGAGAATCDDTSGGFNGGADGVSPQCGEGVVEVGAGGGGGSDLRVGGDALSNRILVAGGGGGGGPQGGGGSGGGSTGGDAAQNEAFDQSCGGAGGDQSGSTGSGQLGVGSPGEDDGGDPDAGGGGGYYGGAGGGTAEYVFCGGGGGSGFFDPAMTSNGVLTSGVRAGDGIVTITYTAPQSTMSSVSAAPTSSVFGQPVTFSDSITPTPDGGTVQWKVDGTDSGSALPVSGSTDLGPVSDLTVGSHSVEADYSGDTNFVASSDSIPSYVVAKAATTTSVAVAASQLSAQVAVVSPGAGTPTGTVTFAVDGKTVGSAPVAADGSATLAHASSGAHGVSATYSGDGDFLGSAGSTTTKNPTIKAHVTSAHPKSAAGWYRSPVKVSFTCTPNGSPLVGGCPRPATLSDSAGGQTVIGVAVAANGGVAEVTVSPINIDRAKPTVRIAGVKNGRKYGAFPAPKVKCVAHDALSGLAKTCVLTTHRHKQSITYTATARDKAGNVATTTARIKLRSYFIVGETPTAGQFTVHLGRSYLVGAAVRTSTAPVYEQAALAGSAPHPDSPVMTKAGKGEWTTRISITPRMKGHTDWVVGVKVGKTSHLIRLRVVK